MDLLGSSGPAAWRMWSTSSPPRQQPLPFGPPSWRSRASASARRSSTAQRGQGSGHLSGHVGFAESVGMIADGIGWDLGRLQAGHGAHRHRRGPQESLRPSPLPGSVAGVAMKAWGYKDGKCLIEMDHPQQIEPEQVGVHDRRLRDYQRHPRCEYASTPRRLTAASPPSLCA